MSYAYKRGSVFYIGYRDATGKEVRKRCKATSLTEARKLAAELARREERVALGLDEAPVKPMRFGELAEKYIAIKVPRWKSGETMVQRIRDHILPVFADRLISSITPADIQILLNRATVNAKPTKLRPNPKPRPASPQTKQHLLNHIGAMYSFATAELRLRVDNPATHVEPPEIPEREPKVMEPEQISSTIECVPDRWRGLFATAAYTALRKGELLGLLVERVDMDSRLITIDKSHGGTTKGKKRVVPIPEELEPYLKVELGRVRSKYLFPALDGGRQGRDCNLPRTLRNALKAAGFREGFDHVCRRCGHLERQADAAVRRCPKCDMMLWPKEVALDFSFKDLRSSCATHSYEATGDIRFVQALLGHDDVKTTDRYAKRRAARLVEQGNKLRYGAGLSVGARLAPVSALGVKRSNEVRSHAKAESGRRSAGLENDKGCESILRAPTSERRPVTPEVRGSSPLPLASASGGNLKHSSLRVPATQSTEPELVSNLGVPEEGLPSPQNPLLTVRDVAARLSLHPNTVYLLIRRGELGCVRLGAMVRVSSAQLAAFISGGSR